MVPFVRNASPIRRFIFAGFTLVLLLSCKPRQKGPTELLSVNDLPFGADRTSAAAYFQKNGWQRLEEAGDRIIFFFPAAVPEELRKLPVMGEEGVVPEPYTMQVYFNPEGKAAVIIVHRYDTAERMESFFQTVAKDYGLADVKLSHSEEKSGLGNLLSESKGGLDTGKTIFVVLRSTLLPVEEKLKNGMNDELEIRIFPKALNEGISLDAVLEP